MTAIDSKTELLTSRINTYYQRLTRREEVPSFPHTPACNPNAMMEYTTQQLVSLRSNVLY
jgi:hypothetical protein